MKAHISENTLSRINNEIQIANNLGILSTILESSIEAKTLKENIAIDINASADAIFATTLQDLLHQEA